MRAAEKKPFGRGSGKPALSSRNKLDMAVLKARLAALPPGVPHTFFLGLTSRCNLRCRHCKYSGAAPAEMPRSLLARLLKQAAAAGVPRVVFFGGEPLLYKGLDAAVALAAELGLFTELDTNGWALTPARASALSRAGLACAMVSVHSGEEARHDALSGPGSFARAVAALRSARSAGLITYVSSCVFAGGLRAPSLRRLLAFAKQNGAQGARLLPYAPPAGKGTPPGGLAARLRRADPGGYAGTCSSPGTPGCAATRGEVLFCAPDGTVRSCPYAAAALGSAGKDPLAKFLAPRRGRPSALFPCRTVC